MTNFKGIPTPLIRRQGIDPKAKTGALRGEVCLKFKDALTGKVMEEFRGHNMVTHGLESALNGCPFDLDRIDGSNTNRQSGWVYHPIYENLLGGIILFPQALGNDPDLLFPPFSNMPTGYASCDSYQQGDPKQGAYDAVSSKVITNGFRQVFIWGSAFGNGDIASLGLAPKYCEGWCKDVSLRVKPYPAGDSGFGARVTIGYGMVGAISEKGMLFIAQRGSDARDSVMSFYSNNRPHSLRLTQDMNDNMWTDLDSDGGTYVPYQYSNEHRNGYTWSVRIPNLPTNYNFANVWNRYNFQIIGDYVYVVYHHPANDGGLKKFTVFKLDISDGTTVDESTYTFNASFGDCQPVYYGGYIYCCSNTAGTIYKCECATSRVVAEITNSAIPANGTLRFVGTQFIYNQYFILDASCDIVVANTGRVSQSWAEGRAYDDGGWSNVRPIYDDGMWLVSHSADRSGTYIEANIKQWGLMTHYDLAETVQKTIDKQMEVYYTITQV